MLNNKGQIAETITWVVATVIIIVTLIIFIFISISISESKNISPSNFVSQVGSFFVSNSVGEISRLELKTIFALSLNENNKEKINEWIKNE